MFCGGFSCHFLCCLFTVNSFVLPSISFELYENAAAENKRVVQATFDINFYFIHGIHGDFTLVSLLLLYRLTYS